MKTFFWSVRDILSLAWSFFSRLGATTRSGEAAYDGTFPDCSRSSEAWKIVPY